MDDDEDYPPQGGCIGFGAMHELSNRGGRVKKHPIGFVHFPDKPERKATRPQARKQRKRRK